jgi:glutamate synthase (NADPH/NADH) large chain
MLGLRGLEQAVGRTDLLSIVPERIPAHANFRFDRLLGDAIPGQMFKTQNQDGLTDNALDRNFVAAVMEAIASGSPYQGDFDITNVDRSTGTITGAEITRLHPHGVESDTASLSFRGSAGQSFGAFIPRGLTLRLEGDANDYVGKGLSGGRIIISTPANATFESHLNVIAGNVIGYGATSGEIFLNGVVGERLGVRNSGATIVVEGVGDHACEYMTGGRVVILGETGRNLGAGMSGGTLYLYDPRELLNDVLANGDFEIDYLDEESDEALHQLLHRYVEETRSKLAQEILSSWSTERMRFVQVQSVEYAAAQSRNHG